MTVIDIRIQRITQLYDSLDPSPLHEKTLSRAVENYIVDCAGALLHKASPLSW